jgi:hypothetical protein
MVSHKHKPEPAMAQKSGFLDSLVWGGLRVAIAAAGMAMLDASSQFFYVVAVLFMLYLVTATRAQCDRRLSQLPRLSLETVLVSASQAKRLVDEARMPPMPAEVRGGAWLTAELVAAVHAADEADEEDPSPLEASKPAPSGSARSGRARPKARGGAGRSSAIPMLGSLTFTDVRPNAARKTTRRNPLAAAARAVMLTNRLSGRSGASAGALVAKAAAITPMPPGQLSKGESRSSLLRRKRATGGMVPGVTAWASVLSTAAALGAGPGSEEDGEGADDAERGEDAREAELDGKASPQVAKPDSKEDAASAARPGASSASSAGQARSGSSRQHPVAGHAVVNDSDRALAAQTRFAGILCIDSMAVLALGAVAAVDAALVVTWWLQDGALGGDGSIEAMAAASDATSRQERAAQLGAGTGLLASSAVQAQMETVVLAVMVAVLLVFGALIGASMVPYRDLAAAEATGTSLVSCLAAAVCCSAAAGHDEEEELEEEEAADEEDPSHIGPRIALPLKPLAPGGPQAAAASGRTLLSSSSQAGRSKAMRRQTTVPQTAMLKAVRVRK